MRRGQVGEDGWQTSRVESSRVGRWTDRRTDIRTDGRAWMIADKETVQITLPISIHIWQSSKHVRVFSLPPSRHLVHCALSFELVLKTLLSRQVKVYPRSAIFYLLPTEKPANQSASQPHHSQQPTNSSPSSPRSCVLLPRRSAHTPPPSL